MTICELFLGGHKWEVTQRHGASWRVCKRWWCRKYESLEPQPDPKPGPEPKPEPDDGGKKQAWIKVSDVVVEWPTGKFDFGESRIRVSCNIISSSGEYPRLFANDPHHNLDVFSVGGKSLGLKLYNKAINFTSGERRNDKPPDHYGIFRVGSFKGRHTCEIYMSAAKSQAWALWDNVEVGRWDIAIVGGAKAIGKIECGGNEYRA